MGSGDFDENQVGVGHPTWVDPLVDLTLDHTDSSCGPKFAEKPVREASGNPIIDENVGQKKYFLKK